MLNRTSQTKRLSGRAQSTLERKTAPITSTPPMVGVPCLPPCSSARRSHFLGAANRLADFERDQFSNDVIPKEQREDERGDRRRNRAKSDVKENVEAADLLAQAMEIIHHRACPPPAECLANSSSTRSVRAERLPLIRTRSPGRSDFAQQLGRFPCVVRDGSAFFQPGLFSRVAQ